jgi:hypothetical protein
MYSKEEIINEIKRIAENLGTQTLKIKDFEMNSTIPLSTLKYYLGSWKQALQEAGLEAKDIVQVQQKLEHGDDDELLKDLMRLYTNFGETPTIALIQKEGKYRERLYLSKWKSLDEAFNLARKKFSRTNENIIEINRDEEKLVERSIENILTIEDQPGKQKEKTGEIKKEMTIIEDPIDFSAMIDEIQKEEEKLAENEKVKDKKIKNIIPSPGKPAVDKIIDFSDLGLDEVAITSKIADEEKRVKSTRKDNDFRAFDKIQAPEKIREAERIPEDDKTKEIKIIVDRNVDNQGIKIIPQTIQPRMSKKKRDEVGEPINFRGLTHAPLNEAGVLYLFGMVSHELGFIIETIRPGFPAGEGRRCFDKENNRWEHTHIDFEYKSSQFKEKGYDVNDCDLIVCWIHDWEECPLEILELRSTIKYLFSFKKT